MEPGLASDGRCARVPWMDILENVKGFIDPEYLPDYETLDSDPSHLSLAKVKKLLRYWFNRQKSEEIVFRFRYVLEGSEKVLGKDPKVVAGKTMSKQVPKGRGRPKKARFSSDITAAKGGTTMGVGTIGKKTSRKHLNKRKAHSREIISDSGEEFDFSTVDNVPLSDDDANPIPETRSSTGMNGGPSETGTPVWRKAPANLSSSEVDLWNSFMEKLPESCSNWTEQQAMIQFQVFKGWSNNYHPPGRIHSPSIPPEMRDIRDISSHSHKHDRSAEVTAITWDIPKTDIGQPTDSSEDAMTSNVVSGIPKRMVERVPISQAIGSNRNERSQDISKVSEAYNEPKSLDLGTIKTTGAETPDALQTAKDLDLAPAPTTITKPDNKKEQARTSKGKFAKSIKQSEDPLTGTKRSREDPAESSAAAKLPSPKKLKVDEPPQKSGRRGRSNKNGKEPNAAVLQNPIEPGPSVALTRSKAKIRNTHR